MSNVGEQERAKIYTERFAERARRICGEVAEFLIEKNNRYGDSALNPVRIFSEASVDEQIRVRIDDKLSRLARNRGVEDEDIIKDIIGYLIILQMHTEDKRLKEIEDFTKEIQEEIKNTTA